MRLPVHDALRRDSYLPFEASSNYREEIVVNGRGSDLRRLSSRCERGNATEAAAAFDFDYPYPLGRPSRSSLPDAQHALYQLWATTSYLHRAA